MIFQNQAGYLGNVTKYKTRLVAKAFMMRHMHMWLLFWIAVEHHLDINEMDVETSFLNGELIKTVYMYEPICFIN